MLMLVALLSPALLLIAGCVGIYASRWWMVILWTGGVALFVSLATDELHFPSVLSTGVALLARWFSRLPVETGASTAEERILYQLDQ